MVGTLGKRRFGARPTQGARIALYRPAARFTPRMHTSYL
jgi:hypothetical protein